VRGGRGFGGSGELGRGDVGRGLVERSDGLFARGVLFAYGALDDLVELGLFHLRVSVDRIAQWLWDGTSQLISLSRASWQRRRMSDAFHRDLRV